MREEALRLTDLYYKLVLWAQSTWDRVEDKPSVLALAAAAGLALYVSVQVRPGPAVLNLS